MAENTNGFSQVSNSFTIYPNPGEVIVAKRQGLASLPVDLVNSPPHYRAGGIETIDVIEAWKLPYNLGNTVKYISRHSLKGSALQDLEKAQWYLNREIANRKKALGQGGNAASPVPTAETNGQ